MKRFLDHTFCRISEPFKRLSQSLNIGNSFQYDLRILLLRFVFVVLFSWWRINDKLWMFFLPFLPWFIKLSFSIPSLMRLEDFIIQIFIFFVYFRKKCASWFHKSILSVFFNSFQILNSFLSDFFHKIFSVFLLDEHCLFVSLTHLLVAPSILRSNIILIKTSLSNGCWNVVSSLSQSPVNFVSGCDLFNDSISISTRNFAIKLKLFLCHALCDSLCSSHIDWTISKFSCF